MKLAITKTGLEDALTINFAHELMNVVVESLERGADEQDAQRMLLRWVTMEITGRDNLDDISETELDQFVAANQSTFDTILAHFDEQAGAVSEVAHALFLADHTEVGEA
jgi:hypothetical protein